MELITAINKEPNYKLALAYICRDLPYGQYVQGVPYPMTRDAYELLTHLFTEALAQDMEQQLPTNQVCIYPWPVDQVEH